MVINVGSATKYKMACNCPGIKSCCPYLFNFSTYKHIQSIHGVNNCVILEGIVLFITYFGNFNNYDNLWSTILLYNFVTKFHLSTEKIFQNSLNRF